jgi:hypothetical protein
MGELVADSVLKRLTEWGVHPGTIPLKKIPVRDGRWESG